MTHYFDPDYFNSRCLKLNKEKMHVYANYLCELDRGERVKHGALPSNFHTPSDLHYYKLYALCDQYLAALFCPYCPVAPK